MKESEKPRRLSVLGEGRANPIRAPTGSKDSFYNSMPVEELTPEQRKHFKTIMRKEVGK